MQKANFQAVVFAAIFVTVSEYTCTCKVFKNILNDVQYELKGSKAVSQGHNIVPPAGLETGKTRSTVKHLITEALRIFYNYIYVVSVIYMYHYQL